ncbi:hypothetical protein Thi970DRAFT_02340 [Thiorhodovibrio frisius]|uniref:Uncharacterized protein n=1 Tax=Thiorhodovibrio frisius TaxID=631362 RepID=H8YZG5_9GAMM|nr:hypothetical protein Thi970DRAFT_02340 [Thiorhodovibrio frisius]WPL24385.1 hypothetical protein Thiofri_04604 [Thiorhodovibrio frisius]
MPAHAGRGSNLQAEQPHQNSAMSAMTKVQREAGREISRWFPDPPMRAD